MLVYPEVSMGCYASPSWPFCYRSYSELIGHSNTKFTGYDYRLVSPSSGENTVVALVGASSSQKSAGSGG